MTTDQFAMYDAAYLLGVLTPAERADYEAHLAECPECSRAVSQQAGMPGLLAALTPDQARAAAHPAPGEPGPGEPGPGEPGSGVPETLLPRLMAEVERQRFRRRLSTVLVGVAAAALIVAAVIFGTRAGSSDLAPGSTVPAAMRMVPISPDVPIRARAWLHDKSWGTRVVVACVYQGGGDWPERLPYTMVVIDKSGHAEKIAEWEAEAGKPLVVGGATSTPQSDIAAVQVQTTSGKPILILNL